MSELFKGLNSNQKTAIIFTLIVFIGIIIGFSVETLFKARDKDRDRAVHGSGRLDAIEKKIEDNSRRIDDITETVFKALTEKDTR